MAKMAPDAPTDGASVKMKLASEPDSPPSR